MRIDVTSNRCYVPLSETLRNIRRRAGYPTVEALALALEVHHYRILTFEAAQFKTDEPGDQQLVDTYGKLARHGSIVQPRDRL